MAQCRSSKILIVLLLSLAALLIGREGRAEGNWPASRGFNFGLVYVSQWAVYLATQSTTIRDEGSFHNYVTNPFSPRFDRDTLEFNVIKHTLAGGSYFLFYRSRDYTREEAVLWTAMSSLAFEFTIETLTERPSYQDIFVTPMFGSAFGLAIEPMSNYFLTRASPTARALGYLLNPFRLLPRARQFDLTATPIVRPGLVGARLAWSF